MNAAGDPADALLVVLGVAEDDRAEDDEDDEDEPHPTSANSAAHAGSRRNGRGRGALPYRAAAPLSDESAARSESWPRSCDLLGEQG
jgi:hypothetical protein